VIISCPELIALHQRVDLVVAMHEPQERMQRLRPRRFNISPCTILATSPTLTGLSSKISCTILSDPLHQYTGATMGTG
jgi:hypothetical protein